MATVSVASLLFVQLLTSFVKGITISNAENNKDTADCISKIISNCFIKGSTVTIVNGNNDNEIIETVNNINFVTIKSRTIAPALHTMNDAYIITINNANDIDEILKALKHDFGWDPNAKFIVVTKSNDEDSNVFIFKHFLNYRVNDIVVVSECKDNHLYTYNPYENNGCGRGFERITSHGSCITANLTNIYPTLPDKSFKNCELHALISNSPPFCSTEDPHTRNLRNLGVEIYVLEILAELEQFNILYSFYNAEDSSVITNNVSVNGAMRSVHENEADMILGGMILVDQRAKVFSYLWSHVTFVDELKIIVKKAGAVPVWKYIYLEFDFGVWVLLLLTFSIIFAIITLKLGAEDKIDTALMMLEHMLQHGSRLGNAVNIRWITIHWIVFAYLISTYYQSHLTGLMTHPSQSSQLSNEKDLMAYKLKPYFSSQFKQFLKSLTNTPIKTSEQEVCDVQLECLRKVSESYDGYTVIEYSLYQKSKWKYCDIEGNHLLYPFQQPYSKLIYAIYFYKGFPLIDKLHLHTLRIKESGIVNKYLNDFYYKHHLKFYASKRQVNNFIIPWYILACGSCLSTVSLVLEIIIHNY